MADRTEKSAIDPIRDRDEIDEALARAVQLALWRHKQLGVPIVVWRDGKIVEIPPEEIPVTVPPNDLAPQSALHAPRRTATATYANGVLKLDAPLDLPADARVRLTVEPVT